MTILTIGTATHTYIKEQVKWYARNARWLDQAFNKEETLDELYLLAANLTIDSIDELKGSYYSLDYTTHKMAKALLIDNGEWKGHGNIGKWKA